LNIENLSVGNWKQALGNGAGDHWRGAIHLDLSKQEHLHVHPWQRSTCESFLSKVEKEKNKKKKSCGNENTDTGSTESEAQHTSSLRTNVQIDLSSLFFEIRGAFVRSSVIALNFA